MEEFFERWLGRFHLIDWLASVIVGLTPTTVIAYLKGLPLLVSVFMGIGVACTIVGIIYAIRTLIVKFPRFFFAQIPISKAVRIMYERIEKGGYGEMLSHTTKTSTEKLSWMSNSLLALREDSWHVKVYGSSPPSTIQHLISENDLKKLRWKEGTDELHSDSVYKLIYNNVSVNRCDLQRHIKMMRKSGQAAHGK